MSEKEGWEWVYGHDRKLRDSKPARRPEVCFTGFNLEDKERLSALALEAGFNVKDKVTKGLALLVTGYSPGPSKLEKAKCQDCVITDEAGFLDYLRSRDEI